MSLSMLVGGRGSHPSVNLMTIPSAKD